jgi:DNA replication protein DnaC
MSDQCALYVTAHKILTSQRRSRADQSWYRELLKYARPELLIIDDLRLRPLQGDEPMGLYGLVRQRYERGSTAITSNRDLPECYALFGDNWIASEGMNRLLHHTGRNVIQPDSN